MRIGIYVPAAPRAPVESLMGVFERAEAAGFATAWFGQLFDHDALTVLALAAQRTRRIELGSWVVPVPPRHPSVLAQQALTVQAASGNRLVLGVGASHAAIIEGRLGLDASRPLAHMREYLDVLMPLLAGESVDARGEHFRVTLQIGTQGAEPPPVLLAALGPRMLALAGERADGVAVWLGGPRYLETFALPRLLASARDNRRTTPRIAIGLPVLLVDDAARGRAAAEAFLSRSSKLPAYRRVLEREGAKSPADVALLGDEDRVARALEHLEALGVTDFNAVVVPVEGDPGAWERTVDFLAAFARDR